jgi:endonuclease-3 related protein
MPSLPPRLAVNDDAQPASCAGFVLARNAAEKTFKERALMTGLSRLVQASTHLAARYGSGALDESSSAWTRFVSVLLVGSLPGAASGRLKELLEAEPFMSPRVTSGLTTGQLVELLAPVPRGPQKAGVLKSFAEWWLTQFGEECSPDWTRDSGFYRESLRRIRGLGPATVDELLLFGARVAVFPLNRGALRVAVRHGWLDLPIEDDEAQDFFVRGLGSNGIDAREFSRLMSLVADSHCGREPNCEGCPLQPLLPPGGPLNPDSC